MKPKRTFIWRAETEQQANLIRKLMLRGYAEMSLELDGESIYLLGRCSRTRKEYLSGYAAGTAILLEVINLVIKATGEILG